MILPLPECPVGYIIGSTHNVWQEGVFIFFFQEEGGRRGLSGVGVVTVATVSNHTVIIHRRKYTRPRYCLLCSKTNTPPFSPAACLSIHLPPVKGWVSGWRSPSAADSVVPMSTLSTTRRVRLQGQENKVEDAAAPVWSCCFVPLQCTEIAQINLLFAWLGQYVCVFVCMCVCVSGCSAPFSPLHFNRTKNVPKVPLKNV